MFELVIPVAGKGSRFTDKTVPKPLIEITNGGITKTLLDWSMDCLPMELVRKVHFVTNAENDEVIEAHVREKWGDKVDLDFVVDSNPQGQAASALLGIQRCNGPMIMANCDQWVKPCWRNDPGLDRHDWTPLYDVLTGKVSVMVPTFNGEGPKWSYVVEDNEKDVACLVEKPSIPLTFGKAIVGIFAYHESAQAAAWIEAMMKRKFTVNGEYYTAPSINEAVQRGYIVKSMPCTMYGIGTPEDVEFFEKIKL
jgi:dTDP-glucose pyrophosphorylase